jgi:hypothetical protein
MSEGAPTDPDGVLARILAPDLLSDAELLSMLAELEAHGRRVDAAQARLAGEVAHRSRRELGTERLSARLGCRTAGELIQRTTGISGIAASRRIRLGLATRAEIGLTGARVPARFAAVGEALATGSLGVDAAHAIISTLEPALRVALRDHVAKGERELVDAATETWTSDDVGEVESVGGDAGARTGAAGCPVIDADDVRLQAKVWAEYLDPDGGAPDERDEERRFLTLHPARRGLVPVSGLLMPQVAAGLRKYADAWTNPKTDRVPDPSGYAATEERRPAVGCDDVEAESAQADDAAADAHLDTRSRAQVLHDVLATALNVAARAVDAPSVAGNAPTLVVVAREEDLRTGEGVARTDDGTAVNIAAARHVACAGAMQRVSLDATGRVVGIWSPERCFTGPQRRAIAVRDGGCVIPGCHVPAAWCEVHHVVPHADDPTGTTTDNGVLLCWHHHRTIDTSGWAIRMRDGLPWVRPPGWLDRTGRWRPARAPGHSRRA